MQAVGVIPHQREVRLLQQEIPQVTADNQVKVRTLDVGICGTDKEICTFVYGSPPAGSDFLVLGHESLGIVVEVGDGVSTLKPGDLVVPSVRRPCPHVHCFPCQTERQDFCRTGDFIERGIKMVHGFMTEYYVEEEKYLTPVPPGLRDIAVLVEPLTVAEKGLAQVWQIKQRLPWSDPQATADQPGRGKNAVVLGAGPIGILGAMLLVAKGFTTYVYSQRGRAGNPKADLIESFGARYISSTAESPKQLAERAGTIDLVYEAVGRADIAYALMKELGLNGVFIFTGIPAPHAAIPIEADNIMRNVVLMNQVIVGTVNADRQAFEAAIRDLELFHRRWPAALRSLITGRYRIDSYRELLVGESKTGIKNVITFD